MKNISIITFLFICCVSACSMEKNSSNKDFLGVYTKSGEDALYGDKSPRKVSAREMEDLDDQGV